MENFDKPAYAIFILVICVMPFCQSETNDIKSHALISTLPDTCGYQGIMSYASKQIPSVQWNLVECPKQIFWQLESSGAIVADKTTQTVVLHLLQSNRTLQEVCKLLQGYFDIFDSGWFSPNNTKMKTNFQLNIGSIVHNFALELKTAVQQSNLWLDLHQNPMLQYTRNDRVIPYLGTNVEPGFLDTMFQFGIQNPQKVDVAVATLRQINLAQSILDLLGSKQGSSEAILNNVEGKSPKITEALLDFVLTTSVSDAVYPETEMYGESVKGRVGAFDKWVLTNQVNLENNYGPQEGLSPRLDEYVHFLLHQFASGNMTDIGNVRDLFCDSPYWDICTRATPNTLGSMDMRFSSLYNAPFVPEPQANTYMQQAAQRIFNAQQDTKERSVVEADVKSVAQAVTSAMASVLCTDPNQLAGACIPVGTIPQFNQSSLNCDVSGCAFSLMHPYVQAVQIQVQVPLQELFTRSYAHELISQCLQTSPQEGCYWTAMQPLIELVLATENLANGYTFHSSFSMSDVNKNDPMSMNDSVNSITKAILLLSLRNIAQSADQETVVDSFLSKFYDAASQIALLTDLEGILSINVDSDITVVADRIRAALNVPMMSGVVFGALGSQLYDTRYLAQAGVSALRLLQLGFLENDLGLVQNVASATEINALMQNSSHEIANTITGGFIASLVSIKAVHLNSIQEAVDLSAYEFKGIYNCSGGLGNVTFTDFMPSNLGNISYISLTLKDDDTLTFELANVPDPQGVNTYIGARTFNCSAVHNVILGVGYTTFYSGVGTDETADTLYLRIPEWAKSLVQSDTEQVNPVYATITGSSMNNKFYVVQNENATAAPLCKSGQSTPLTLLTEYQYSLIGNDGDDQFFLGPRTSIVAGGSGHDLYFASDYGTQCTIDNSAADMLSDTLYLAVSFNEVMCSRIGNHLVINYCSSHHIEVLNWFINTENHLSIVTSDGMQLSVTDHNINVSVSLCSPVALDAANMTMAIDLNTSPLLRVQTVLAGAGNIFGNAENNYFMSSAAGAILQGGAGADTYLIAESTIGCVMIDNLDESLTQDLVVISTVYDSINVTVLNGTSIAVIGNDGLCALLLGWFQSSAHQHVWFLSSDKVPFEIVGNADSLSKRPLLIDQSYSKDPVAIDLISSPDVAQVVVVNGSPYADNITGNSFTNYIFCSGSDVMSGGPQSDIYVLSETCLSAAINNYETDEKLDVLLISFKFSDLYFSANASDLLVGSYENGTVVTLTDWFSEAANRHLIIATSDGVTSMLPNTTSDMTQWKYTPKPVEIDLPASCDCTVSGKSKTYDLSQPPYQSVTRFSSESTLCSYIVIGNSLDNYMDPGQGNPSGLQYLEGGDGADAYVIGVNYGLSNQINNFAYDGKMDLLLLGIQSQFLSASLSGQQHVQLSSTHNGDNVSVLVYNYLTNASYQHLLVQTIDKTLFVITDSYPYLKPIIVDRSDNPYAVQMNTSQASVVYGSRFADNMIEGSNTKAQRIVGGNGNDILQTNAPNALLEGLTGNDELVGSNGIDTILGGDGNDKIVANDGDDVLYGGGGQDNMDGGAGQDTIVFAGDAMLSAGVNVSLRLGIGLGADANGDEYSHIESIYGSEFSDVLEGSDGDNTLAGYGGDDVIVPLGGVDMLYGGAGKDLYDLSTASGWKGITNFATDGLQDVIAINVNKFPIRCNYSLGNDSYFHYGPRDESLLSAYEINSSEVLNVVAWNFLWSQEFQHLATCGEPCETLVLIDKDNIDSVDAAVNLFKANSVLTLAGRGNSSLTVAVKEELLQLPIEFRIDLAYVCDGSDFSVLPNAVGETVNLTIDGLVAGVMCTVTQVLVRCNQVLAKSATLHARTMPNPPAPPQISFSMSNDLTISYGDVFDDYNGPLYQYNCQAICGNLSYDQVTTVLNTTTCNLQELQLPLKYDVVVESIAGNVLSSPSSPQRISTGCSTSYCSERPSGMFPITPCYASYCMCSNGYPYIMPCYSGLFFNQATGQCDYPKNIEGCFTFDKI